MSEHQVWQKQGSGTLKPLKIEGAVQGSSEGQD